MKKRFALFAFCIALVIGCSLQVTADYTVSDGEIEYIPQAYVYEKSISILTGAVNPSFNQPLDLYISADDSIYVADTSNNRVVQLNTDGVLLAEYTSAAGINLSSPRGVCVTDNGQVYIADTGNGRIVCLTADGDTISVFEKPDSALLADIETYTPTKIAISPTGGGLYVLMGENIMNIDMNNQVRGFIGQTDIGFSLTEWLLRIFATDEQRRNLEKRTSASYDNFHVSNDGLIYAVSRDTTEGQIKVFNTVGNNIYRKISSIENESNLISNAVSRFFTGNIITKAFSYGETVDGQSAVFSDLCADNNGIISAIQQQNGKIYQYDQSGNLLAVFGGLGTKQGEFSIPCAIATDSRGYIYILDSSYGNIQIFRPTDFILAVQRAVTAHNNNQTDEAAQYWEQVLDADDTYSLAYWGLGNVHYKNGSWKQAMECYRLSNDRQEYSKAFAEYRFAWIEEHIGWVLLTAIILIAILYAGLSLLSKRCRAVLHRLDYESEYCCGFKDGCVLAFGGLLHPFATFIAIRENRGKVKTVSAVFIIVLTLAVRLLFVFTAGYAMRDVELDEVNIALELIKLLLPIASWIIAGFLISEQFDGEATLKECFISTAYSMTPYIVINIIAAAVSHILCWNERGFFALLVNGVMLWCALLLVLAVKIMNNYTVKSTVKVVFFTICAVVLLWFSALLGYAVIARVFTLIREITNEFGLLFS